MGWSELPASEIERRRLESVAELERRDREDFNKWYQEMCDIEYWKHGQCCAGCDHWHSDAGNTGQCQAGGILSGHDVMMSITGGGFSSYTPPPGYPYRSADHWCSLFKDDFDWSSLPWDYLKKIGAIEHGEIKRKPGPPR